MSVVALGTSFSLWQREPRQRRRERGFAGKPRRLVSGSMAPEAQLPPVRCLGLLCCVRDAPLSPPTFHRLVLSDHWRLVSATAFLAARKIVLLDSMLCRHRPGVGRRGRGGGCRGLGADAARRRAAAAAQAVSRASAMRQCSRPWLESRCSTRRRYYSPLWILLEGPPTVGRTKYGVLTLHDSSGSASWPQCPELSLKME